MTNQLTKIQTHPKQQIKKHKNKFVIKKEANHPKKCLRTDGAHVEPHKKYYVLVKHYNEFKTTKKSPNTKKAAKNQPLSKKQTTLPKRKEEKANTDNKTNQDVRDYKQEI